MPRQRSTSQARALDLLHERIRRCDRCPLHRTRTQAVPGTGPVGARVVFVGEAPGRQEDLTGEPFVGAAGKFLDELLASVGLSRATVFITNVVKSRPVVGRSARRRTGRNRVPTPEEITACTPWLKEQLAIIRPKVIVTLGRVALDYFLPGRTIRDVHGRPIASGGLTILPLYHPAMVLYRRAWRRMLKQDFGKLSMLLSEAPHLPP